MNGKKLRYGLVFIVLTTLIYMLMELRYGLPIRPLRPKHYAAAAVLAACSCLIHSRRAAASPGYAGELLLGCRNQPGRIVYMDYLRVLASFLVILVHVLEPAYAQLPPPYLFQKCDGCGGRSGLKLQPAVHDAQRGTAAGRKGGIRLTILFPALCQGADSLFCLLPLILLFMWKASLPSVRKLGQPDTELPVNDSGQTPHFWLVYIILMFYVAAPFFRIMLRHMTEPMLEALAAVIFYPAFHLHLRPSGSYTVCSLLLPGIMGLHFPAGILLHHPVCHEALPAVHDGRPVVRAGNSRLHHGPGEPGPLVYNNAPPQMLFTCAVFLFFRKHGDRLFARIPTLLSAIGRYSFSILLIHWLVLHRIVGDVFGINGLSFGIAGGILVSFLLTLVISLALSFLYDNTVVLCMDRACEIFFGVLGRVGKRLGRFAK